MTYKTSTQTRQARKAQARRMAKDFAARMKIHLIEGGQSPINSAKAVKIIERGTISLIVNEGRPFTMQISHGEAAAFLGDEVDLTGRYAIAFAVDRNGNPYTTLPVCSYPLADYTGPAPTAQELAQHAEQAAYQALFNEQFGLHPHVPRHVADADRRRP